MIGVTLPLESAALEPKRKIQSVDLEGNFVWAEDKSIAAQNTEVLARIWNEYPDGLLDMTEDDLNSKSLDEDAVPGGNGGNAVDGREDGENIPTSGMMKWEDMAHLREAVGTQLNNARNELWFSLELAKTLALSSGFSSNPPLLPDQDPSAAQKKKAKQATKEEAEAVAQAQATPGAPDAPIFPPGTMSSTPFDPAPHAQAQIIYDLELALAAKQTALDQCERMIDTAVEEFQRQASASERFWRDIRQLSEGVNGRGQWAIIPKPDFAKVLGKNGIARDVVIPYAIDEASMATRSKSLAAFDLDPSQKAALTFGARSHRRIKLRFTDASVMSTSSAVPADSILDNLAEMEEAQLESFEEDMWQELRDEISRRPGGVVEAESLRLAIGDQNIEFEMVSTDSHSRDVTSQSPSTMSDLILSTCRLSYIVLLRQRKRRLTSPTWSRPPSILAPIIQILYVWNYSQKISRALDRFARVLTKVGVESKVITRSEMMEPMGVAKIERLLAGDQDYSPLGAVFNLEVEGCPGISINISATTPGIVTTSQATFPLTDPSELPQLVADDLVSQLLRWTEKKLKSAIGDDGRRTIFLDELEEALVLPNHQTLRMSIPPPHGSLRVSLRSSKEDTADTHAFDHDGELSLLDWIRGAADM